MLYSIMVRVSAFILSNHMHNRFGEAAEGFCPRGKRNARKRSFEQCMSATAAKILKMEQERETSAGEKVNSGMMGCKYIYVCEFQNYCNDYLGFPPTV